MVKMERDISFFNKFGDTRINWDEDADEKMLTIIQRLMDSGVSFWKVKPILGFPVKKKLKRVSSIKDDRVLSIKDEDFFKLVEAGMAGVVGNEPQDAQLELSGRHKTAQSVVSHSGRTVATAPLRGG